MVQGKKNGNSENGVSKLETEELKDQLNDIYGELMDIEVGVFIVIFILIDEVKRIFINFC